MSENNLGKLETEINELQVEIDWLEDRIQNSSVYGISSEQLSEFRADLRHYIGEITYLRSQYDQLTNGKGKIL